MSLSSSGFALEEKKTLPNTEYFSKCFDFSTKLSQSCEGFTGSPRFSVFLINRGLKDLWNSSHAWARSRAVSLQLFQLLCGLGYLQSSDPRGEHFPPNWGPLQLTDSSALGTLTASHGDPELSPLLVEQKACESGQRALKVFGTLNQSGRTNIEDLEVKEKTRNPKTAPKPNNTQTTNPFFFISHQTL